jgi:hypothetical protein
VPRFFVLNFCLFSVFCFLSSALQRVNRDTMSFATKLASITYKGAGQESEVMKMPTTDSGKFSLPGVLQVRRERERGVAAACRVRVAGEARWGIYPLFFFSASFFFFHFPTICLFQSLF